MASTGGFLGGGGRLFFCTAFNHALTRLLLLAFRLYVNRPPLAAVGSCCCCWPLRGGGDGCPPSHRIVVHGDGGPAAAGGGRTYSIIARCIFNARTKLVAVTHTVVLIRRNSTTVDDYASRALTNYLYEYIII